MSAPNWLPPMIRFDGNWETFIDDVYAIFTRDFKMSRPNFRNLSVTCDMKLSDGREEGFWHLTSYWDRELQERIPDVRRSERIAWSRPVIENSNNQFVSIWHSKRANRNRVLLWRETQDYLVVLEDRKNYFVLVTAYITDRKHTRRKLRKERDEFREKQTPPF